MVSRDDTDFCEGYGDRERSDRHQVIVQVTPKYRGSFNTYAFGEIKPHSGSFREGRLDLAYHQDPGLSVEDPLPL